METRALAIAFFYAVGTATGGIVGAPTITNDGVTIAREIEVEDVFQNEGCAARPRGRDGDQ
jgi:hypothetical protein